MSVLNIKDNTWNEFINQVDTGEEISGGVNGNANIATRQLAENVFFIKTKMYELAQSKNDTLSESQKTEFIGMINDRINAVENLISEYKDLTDSEVQQVVNMIRDEVNVSLEQLDTAVKDNTTRSDELSEKIDNEISEAMENFQDAINSIEASDQAVEETIRTVLGARYEDGKSPLEMTLALLLQEETVRAEKDFAQAKRIDILQSSIGGEYEAFKTWKYYEDPEDWIGGIYHPEEYSLKVLNSELVSPSIAIDGGKFNHVKLRIKRIGEPTWKGKVLWNGRSETEFKDIEEPLDWNDGKFITLNIDLATEWRQAATINTVYFRLTDNADANNYFIIDWISIGRNTPGISTAQIATIENTITELDSAVAERLTSIEADLVIPGSGYGEGSYKEWIASTIGPEGAQTKKLETLDSKWEGAEGFESVVDIINNLETKTTADEARALSNETITAKFGNLTKDDLTPIVNSYGEYVDKVDIVVDAEKATAEKLEGLRVEYDESSVDFNERLTINADANEATAKLVTSLTSRTEGVEGSISSIEEVITNADGTGLVQRMDNLELDIDGEDGISARITSLDKIVSDNNTTTVQRLSDLDLSREGLESSITSLESIVDLENENSVITSRFSSIDSKVGENSGSINSLERIVDMGNEDSVIVTKFNDLNAKTDGAIGSITQLEEVVVGPNNSIVTQISNLDGRTAATEGSISELQETTNTLTTSITENNREISSRFNIIEDIEIVPGYSSAPEYYKNRWGDILKRRVFDNEEDLRNYTPDLNGTDLGKSKEIKTAADLGIDTHTGNVYVETSVPSADKLISEMVVDEDGNVIEPAVYEYTIDNAKNVEQTVYTDTGRVFTRNSTGNDAWSTWFEVIDTSEYEELLKVAKAILYGTASNTNSVISVKEKTYADMETAMSEIVTAIESEVDGNAANIDTITKTYATKDYVGGEITSEIDNKFKTVDGVVTGSLALELKKAWSDDFSSTSEKLENFVADYDGNIADVIDSVKAYADSDSASAQKLDALTVGFGDKSLSDFESEIKLYADKDSTSAKKIDSLTAEYGLNKTKVSNEIKVVADVNKAQTERMDTMSAEIGDNSAAITSEELARTTEDAAIVKSVTELSTRTDNAEGRISRAETAISNAEGSIVTAREELTSSYTAAINTAKGESATDAQDKANKAKTAAIAEAKRLSDLAESAAKSYASTEQNLAEVRAKAYADGVVTAEELARLAQAKDNLDAAMLDSQKKANAAKQAAIEAAAADATVKANQSLSDSQALILQAVEGIEIGGRNLFIQNDKADRWYLNIDDGLLIGSGVHTTSGYIEIKPNTNYIFYAGGDRIFNFRVAFYDIDKTFISAYLELGTQYNPRIINTVTNSKYLKFSLETRHGKGINNWKLEKGNKVTAWTPAPEDLQLTAEKLATEAKEAAQTFATTKAEAERVKAEAYADGIVTIEEEERIKQANAIAEAAKLDATKKADAAKSAAVIAAAADADSKVSQAILNSKAEAVKLSNEALAAAKVYANAQAAAERLIAEAHADNIVTAEEQARIAQALQVVKDAKADATKKADAAQDAAIKAAALDATAKANKALEDAKKDSANKVAALKVIVDSKASVTSVEKVVNDANQALAAVEGKVTSAYSKAIEEIEIGGRNLIIQKNIVKGRYVNHIDGALNSAGHDTTDFIPVESGKTYTLSASKYLDYNRVVFYDADKAFISGIVGGSRETLNRITPPLGTAFLRISSDVNSGATSNTWKLEKGNKATDWTPAPEDVTDYIDSEVGKLNTTIDSKADINTVSKVVSDANKSLAELKTSITGEYTKAIGASQTASFLEAKSKADKALADAKSDATKKANDAKDAAAEYTRLEAKAKADAALALASDDATDKANAAKSAAELAAANDAKAKADKALSDAKADATAKSNAAEKAAKEYADAKAKGLTTLISSKADIDTVNKIKNDTDGAIAKQKTDITADYSKAISGIEIGGRNLVLDSAKEIVASSGTAWVKGMPMERNKYYAFSVDLKGTGSIRFAVSTYSRPVSSVDINGMVGYDAGGSTDIPLSEEYQRYWVVILCDNWSIERNTKNLVLILDTGSSVSIKNIKFEKGNRATDWSPAPEDVQASLDATTKLIEKESSARATAIADTLRDAKAYSNQLDEVIKGSFKDGLIDEAEAISIKAHINELNTQKNDLDQKYTSMYANTDLAGTAKTNLYNAKVALNSKYTDLVNYINSVTSNGKVTKAQSEAVSTKFTAYAAALKLLSQRFEEANDSIVTKAKSDAVSSAKTYTDGVVNPLKKDVESKASVTRVEQAEGYADRAIGESSKTITASYKKAIDDIEIGGRNLLSLNENNWEPGWWGISDGLSSGPSSRHFRTKEDYKILVKPNTQYTANATQRHVYLEYTSDGVYTGISHKVAEPYTFTTSASTSYLRIYALDPTSPLPDWDVFMSYAFKLEKGNKATDWTPAPEDTTSAIEGTIETIKRVEATANGVKAEASSIITVGGKITGWKNLNDGTTSSFDILDDNFSVGNSTTSKKPFKIVGSDIQFNGKVSFNSVVGDVPGSRITNGTLDLNKLNSTDKSLINTASSNASSALSKAGTAQSMADSAWDKAGIAETNAKRHTDDTLKNTIYYPNSTTIDGTKIETGTIVANKLSVNSLSALSANMGAITSGSLNINNRFIVDSSGNMTATSGKFSGTVLASKIEGKVANIENAAVNTLQIAGNAITVTGIYFAEQPIEFQLATGTYELAYLDMDTSGGSVIIDFGYEVLRFFRHDTYRSPTLIMEIKRGDVILRTYKFVGDMGKDFTVLPPKTYLPFVDRPPAGIHHYSVELRMTTRHENDIWVGATGRSLVIRGAKDDRI